MNVEPREGVHVRTHVVEISLGVGGKSQCHQGDKERYLEKRGFHVASLGKVIGYSQGLLSPMTFERGIVLDLINVTVEE